MDNRTNVNNSNYYLGGACIIAGRLFFGLQANHNQENNITSNNTTNITLNTNDSNNSTSELKSNSNNSKNSANNRPAVDSNGVTKKETDYYGWTYTDKHGGHYIGKNDHWDEDAQRYHD